MLLEAFVNRYRNPGVAPIHFATIVLPLTMILGALICFVGTPTVIIMAVCDIYPEVFSPKLSMVCALAGGGLFLAPLAIGAMHGQIREKQRGIVREGYGPKMMAYLFMLGIALPFPALYGAKFFYNYPFAHYPSYILEVKPSPELKAEIERFGLAEIKWHTPYDYSLDRQVIRYDFGEPVDGDWTSYRSKRTIFEEVASQRNAEYINTIVDEYDYSSLILDGVRYPSAVAISENEVKCVISIPLKSKMEISDLKYVVEGGSRELPVLRLVSEEKATDLANVDVSSVFAYYHPESVSGYEQDKLVCSLYGGSLDYLYIAYKLLMPVLHRNVHSFLVEKRTDFSFGGNQLVVALRSL